MNTLKKSIKHVILSVLAFVWIYPVLLIIITSMKTPEEILKASPVGFPEKLYFDNYLRAWDIGRMGDLFGNSIKLLIFSSILILLVSSLASYALARFEFIGKKFLFVYFLSGIMIPIQSIIIALFYVMKQYHLVNTHIGLVFVYTAMGLPMSIFILSNYIKTIPNAIEESATIDGCSKLRFFISILLPLIKPATATVLIVQSLNVWNDLLLQMLLLTSAEKKTLTSGLMYFAGKYTMQWDLILAGVTITSIPIIILYVLLQKNIISGLSSGAIKH